MSVENSEGYCWMRVFVTSITVAFQLILLFSAKSLTTYLLSNISILCGYSLDLYAFKYRKCDDFTQKLLSLSLCGVLISLVFAFSDILFLSEFSGHLLNVVSEAISYTVVPLITIVAMFFYLAVSIAFLTHCIKINKSFKYGE